MKNTKYLYLYFALCMLTNCKKDLNNDVPVPIVETGYYNTQHEQMIGEIRQVSPYLYQYGHVWQHLTSPVIHEGAIFTPFYDRTVASEVDATIFETHDILPIQSHIDRVVPGELYCVKAYWIDIFGNVGYGKEEHITPQ